MSKAIGIFSLPDGMLRFFSWGKECRARTATAAAIEAREESFY